MPSPTEAMNREKSEAQKRAEDNLVLHTPAGEMPAVPQVPLKEQAAAQRRLPYTPARLAISIAIGVSAALAGFALSRRLLK